MTKEIKEEITEEFLKIFRNSIKIKSGDSIYYLYDKDLLLKYKISVLKNKVFDLSKYKNIEWENDLVIFEQDKKNNFFWMKYYKYWMKLEQKYGLNYQEITKIFTDILNTHTNCKQYTPRIITMAKFAKLDKHTNCKQYTPTAPGI